MINYAFQRVTDQEVETLQALAQTIYKHTYDEFTEPEDMEYFLTNDYGLPNLLKQVTNPDSQFYFLKDLDHDTIAGYLKVNTKNAQTEPMDNEHFELERIYLLPDYQHQGLGDVLMNHAEQLASQAGAKYLWLGVYEKNYHAQQFYERHGFKRFSQHIYQVGADAQLDYLLRKQIG